MVSLLFYFSLCANCTLLQKIWEQVPQEDSPSLWSGRDSFSPSAFRGDGAERAPERGRAKVVPTVTWKDVDPPGIAQYTGRDFKRVIFVRMLLNLLK